VALIEEAIGRSIGWSVGESLGRPHGIWHVSARYPRDAPIQRASFVEPDC
jgi:hypothetical protein